MPKMIRLVGGLVVDISGVRPQHMEFYPCIAAPLLLSPPWLDWGTIMLLWLIFAGLTAGALAIALRPAFRIGTPDDIPGSADLAVYAEQLADLDRQISRGVLDDSEHAALRHEISRRVLRASQRNFALGPKTASAILKAIPIVVGVLVPILSIALYAYLGSPGIPSRPFAPTAGQIANASTAELIAKVETRLASHPEEWRGWEAIAPIYFRQGRYPEAASAYQRTILLAGATVPRLMGFAEASVLASDGIVSEPARAAYEKVAAMDPNNFEPRFWLALAKEQDGNRQAAAADYRALLAAAPVDAPWRTSVEQRLAAVTRTAPATSRGPTDLDVKAAAGMTVEQRQTMIESMVETLAVRLKSNGNDGEGWERLISSYMVLKKPEMARNALADAQRAMAGNAAAEAAFHALARRLELEP